MRILGLPIAALAADPELGRHLTGPHRVGDRTYVEAPSLGVGFVDHGDGVVGAIHVDCGATERADLPMGLSTRMSRHEVRTLLGDPESSAEGSAPCVPGQGYAWDRFPVAGEVVHVSYRGHQPGLSRVTVLLRELAVLQPPA